MSGWAGAGAGAAGALQKMLAERRLAELQAANQQNVLADNQRADRMMTFQEGQQKALADERAQKTRDVEGAAVADAVGPGMPLSQIQLGKLRGTTSGERVFRDQGHVPLQMNSAPMVNGQVAPQPSAPLGDAEQAASMQLRPTGAERRANETYARTRQDRVADQTIARTNRVEDQATAEANRESAAAASRQASQDNLRLGASLRAPKDTSAAESSRLDRSYTAASKELGDLAKPVADRLDRLGRLNDTIDQRSPQADAVIAPELMVVMAGGAGSGVRITTPELDAILGGRSNVESIKAALNKWQMDPSKALSITDSQRAQIRSLVGTVQKKAQAKLSAIRQAQHDLIDAPDVGSHRKSVDAVRMGLDQIDAGGGQANSGGGAGVQKWGRDAAGNPVRVQ